MSSKNINLVSADNPKIQKQDILSEYTLKGIIGRGTFSIVKLGENKITKEKVAIKIMQKNKIINKEDLQRIQREIKILNHLNHPNIIKIHKIEEDSKKFYIIMEYCENGELFNRIVEKQRLNEEESALFYYQIISGLEYIHKNKIAHRDLKPENLLLSKNDILKIIDFGLSNYSNCNYLLGTPCGSPCYASPEMVSGNKYNGFLIDIWSTGIILFAMICGYLPFEDKDNEILFEKIVKCKINYPKHIGDLPLDLMKKIIVPNPNKRITINGIKEHPFYLKGKLLFNQKYPDIKTQKIKEIFIKTMNPIKTKILNSKDKKENSENKRKKIIGKNYVINIDNINNTAYQPSITENINYKRSITDNNDLNGSININNVKNLDYNKKEENTSIKEINNNEKEKIDENKNSDKMESPSSILNSEEIPMDTIPNEFNDEKSEQSNLNSNNNEEKSNKIKEEIKSINVQQINNNNGSYTKNNDLSKKSQMVKVNMEKSINKKTVNDNKIKKPYTNIKNPVDILNKDKKKLNDNIIVEYYPNQKSYNSIERSTTNNSNNTENNNFNKSNNLATNQQVPNTSYMNNKINPIYDDKNRILINEIKSNYISNTAPKNNAKINYYPENKYLKNNHNNKTNNIFYKKINNISKYNTQNINDINEKNHINDRENNINLTNINPNYPYYNKVRLNTYTNDFLNNTVNEKMNNRQKIMDIFNELQIIQKNKKRIIEQNNNKNIYNNTYSNKLTNIIENHSLSAGKNMQTTPIKGLNIIQNPKIEFYDLNNKNNKNNTNKQNNKTKNIINTYSERDYNYNNNKKCLNNKSNVKNYRKINDKLIKKINNKNINYTSNYEKENINSFNGRINKDKYFESITINTNNSINMHEPKLYIYVENNNSNNIENINENLKSCKNEKTINSPIMAKFDKNNYNNSKYTNKNNINKSNEYSTQLLIKRANTNTNNDRKINRLSENNRYNDLYNSIDNRKNKTITIYNDYNDNLFNILKKNNKINTKIYNINNKNNEKEINNYLINSNDMIYDSSNKNKDKNIKIINNRYNTINNNIINNSTKNNTVSINKDDYIYQNFRNIAKTEVNLDIWSYDKEKKENNLKNKYFINNNDSRALKGKNLNIINNFISNINPNMPLLIDNIDHKIKLQKIQKRNTVNGKDENYKYIIPKTHKTSDIEYFENYKKTNTITSENSHIPSIKNNNYANRNNKKYIKKFEIKK